MSELLEAFIYACIERAQARREPHRIVLVSSYDPTTHAIKGTRQPDGAETGFHPVATGATDTNGGFVNGPNIGDQYVIGYVNGDPNVPFVAGRMFSDAEKPPTVQAGEKLMQHADGRKVFMDTAGHITVSHPSGSSTTMNPDGSVAHVANKGVTVTAGQGIAMSAGQPMAFSGGGTLT